MSVPQVMPSPRQQIHQYFCPSAALCRFRLKGTFTGPQCKKLDELLDFSDEQLLHAKAHELRGKGETWPNNTQTYSWYTGLAGWLDPYEKVPSRDPDEAYPEEVASGCPGCSAGREHYHRKSDGSPVRVPVDVPRET